MRYWDAGIATALEDGCLYCRGRQFRSVMLKVIVIISVNPPSSPSLDCFHFLHISVCCVRMCRRGGGGGGAYC